MSEWCDACEAPAPVDRDGFFRLHADQFGEWCLNSGEPSPSSIELGKRHSLRRSLARACRGEAYVAGRPNKRRERRRMMA